MLPVRSQAQTERYEVGQRLRAFEAAWDKHTDPVDRRRCVKPLSEAASAFVVYELSRSGSLGKVGEGLDKARQALCSPQAPDPAAVWAGALWLQPNRRLLDTAAASKLVIKLRKFYAVGAEQPKEARLRLTLLDGKDRQVQPAAEFRIPALPAEFPLPLKDVAEFPLPLKDVAEGDYRLRVEVVAAGQVRARSEQGLSLVKGVDERLQALGKKLDILPDKPARTDTTTARAHHDILKSLSEGATQDTDCPAARLLVEAEAAVREVAAGGRYHGNKKPGDFWLALPTRDKPVEVRLLAPQAVKDGKPLPLVIALHGLGGSGHLFFEGYGRGGMVRECEKRGWLLVAPHLKKPLALTDVISVVDWLPVADLIDEVDRLYRVDQKRVHLVGHSMGARLASGLVGREPRRFAAVAALAGGGPWKASDDKSSGELKDVRFFIGVGEKDTVPSAPNWARDLRPALEKAGVAKKNVTFKEYADIEHLLVVQAACEDVFDFFAGKR
jgi:predicted esterase